MSYVFFSYVVPTIHILTCIMLVVVVLLQTGKGADMGAVFGGGSSQTFFGSSGAGNFLTKLTTGGAIVFMLTSLILTYGQRQAPSSSLLDKLPPVEEQAPVMPAPGALPPVDGGAAAPSEPAPTADAGGAAAPVEGTAPTAPESAPGAAPAAPPAAAPEAAPNAPAPAPAP